jgi:cytochrome c556
MKNPFRKMSLVFFLLCFSGFPIHVLSGQESGLLSPGNPSKTTGPNFLIEEMLSLDNTFRNIVSAVALCNGEKVRQAVAATHISMERTREGLRAGTVTLPKNSSRTKDFIEMNRTFYDKLVALDRAARHNNQREMQRITTLLLSACVQCHQTFRK